ncbi:MAG: hypothetical protein BMS9Abin06_1094 [Gammaproteobacteria bacterium]|nr:MAG: hypothetical protein BMS9Abin06_1094 [Gammaproteobacteria bacterium]
MELVAGMETHFLQAGSTVFDKGTILTYISINRLLNVGEQYEFSNTNQR